MEWLYFFSKQIHLCVVSTLQLHSGMDRKFVHSLFMCLSKNGDLNSFCASQSIRVLGDSVFYFSCFSCSASPFPCSWDRKIKEWGDDNVNPTYISSSVSRAHSGMKHLGPQRFVELHCDDLHLDSCAQICVQLLDSSPSRIRGEGL